MFPMSTSKKTTAVNQTKTHMNSKKQMAQIFERYGNKHAKIDLSKNIAANNSRSGGGTRNHNNNSTG